MELPLKMEYGSFSRTTFGDVEVDDYEISIKPESSREKQKFRLPLIVLFAFSVVFFVGATFYFQSSKPTTKFSQLDIANPDILSYIPLEKSEYVFSDVGDMSIETSNEYGVFEGPYPFINDEIGSQLIEPYKATKVSIKGLFANDDNIQFAWNVDGFDSIMSGSEITITVQSTGVFSVSIHAVHTIDGYVSTYTTRLVSK